MGTNGSLARFDGTTWTPKLWTSYAFVNELHVDAAGNVWAGTSSHGVGRFDGIGWTVYTPANSGLPRDGALSLTTDSMGRLWAGMVGGAVSFDGVAWTVFDIANSGIADDYAIHAILVDRLGNTWIGDQYGGLSIYKQGGIATEAALGPDRPRLWLSQNVPNPFNPSTTFHFLIPHPGRVDLRVVDTAGRLVRALAAGDRDAGRHVMRWDGRDDAGRPAASALLLPPHKQRIQATEDGGSCASLRQFFGAAHQAIGFGAVAAPVQDRRRVLQHVGFSRVPSRAAQHGSAARDRSSDNATPKFIAVFQSSGRVRGTGGHVPRRPAFRAATCGAQQIQTVRAETAAWKARDAPRRNPAAGARPARHARRETAPSGPARDRR